MPDLKGSPKPVTSVYSPAINSAKPAPLGQGDNEKAITSSILSLTRRFTIIVQTIQKLQGAGSPSANPALNETLEHGYALKTELDQIATTAASTGVTVPKLESDLAHALENLSSTTDGWNRVTHALKVDGSAVTSASTALENQLKGSFPTIGRAAYNMSKPDPTHAAFSESILAANTELQKLIVMTTPGKPLVDQMARVVGMTHDAEFALASMSNRKAEKALVLSFAGEVAKASTKFGNNVSFGELKTRVDALKALVP